MPEIYDAPAGQTAPKPKKPKPPNQGENTTPSELREFEPPPPRRELPRVEEVVDRTLFAASRTNEIFRETPISELTLYQTPDSIYQSAVVNTDAVTAAGIEEYVQYLAETRGSEAMAAMSGTELLTSPLARARTQELVARIMQLPTPVYGIRANTAREYTDEDIIAIIVAGNMAAFQAMGPADQAQGRTLGQELVENLESLPDTGQAGDLKRGAYIATTGDVSIVLSQEELDTLYSGILALEGANSLGGTVVEADATTGGQRGRGVGFFGEATEATPIAPGLAELGVEQYKNRGEGIIVLDEQDAQKDPVKAFGVYTALQAMFPEKQFVWGRDGAFTSIVDAISLPIDYVTAPLGAALVHSSELAERHGRTEKDKQDALQWADDLEKIIQEDDQEAFIAFMENHETRIPWNTSQLPGAEKIADFPGSPQNDDWAETAMREAVALRDYGTDEVGVAEFVEQMERNTRSQIAGFGFADSFTRSADLLPGDPGYTAAYAVSGLVGALIFDPLNWGPALIGGMRAAAMVPRFNKVMKSDEVVAALIQIQRPTLNDAQALAAAKRMNQLGEVQKVGRGTVKNATYRYMAPEPEVFVTTGQARATSRALFKMKQALGEDDMTAVLAQFFGDSKKVGGGTDVARYISRAKSQEEMDIYLMGAMQGLDAELPNYGRIQARVNELEGVVDTLPASERLDTIQEIARLNDIREGRDFVRPLRRLLTSREMRRLERLTGKKSDVIREYQIAMTELAERLPDEVLTAGADAIQAAVVGDPVIQATALNFWQRLRNVSRTTGAGEVLVFPGTSAKSRVLQAETTGTVDEIAEGLLREAEVTGQSLSPAQARQAAKATIAAAGPMADDVERSFVAYRNMMRRFGLKDERISELMKPWAIGALDDDPIKSFEWFTDSWAKMVDESPRLNAIGRQEFSKMWASHINDRAAGEIRVGPGQYEPTLQRMETTPLGDPDPHSVPAITADMLSTYRLPSEDSLVQYFSHLRRTMLEWNKAGGGKKFVSMLHGGMVHTLSAWASLWKSFVMVPRLVGALPIRIGLEQQLRMPAAAESASLFYHPFEWFQSTTWGTKAFPKTDFALMADSPTHALGSVVDVYDQNQNLKLIHMGRNTVRVNEPGFFRGVSGRMRKFAASPEVREWYFPLRSTPEQIVTKMQDSPLGQHFLALYAQHGLDPVQSVARTKQELQQLIGTGQGSVLMQVALQRGRVTIDGQTLTIGTTEFADAIEGLYRRGEWIPGTERVRVSEGVYLPPERFAMARAVRDVMFRYGYTAPDLAFSRSPLFRQLATREMRNLIRVGYSPEKALQRGYSYAARATADVMFSIGAKTPAEFALRNIMPFFPAYRELAATWLIKAPMRVGEGSWVLGAAALTRRADIWMDFFKQMGWVKTNEKNQNYIPTGFISPLVRLLGGEDLDEVGFSATALVESAAGILPFPTSFFEKDEEGNTVPLYERMRGLIPTLGGPATFGLGLLNEITDGKLDEVVNWLTFTGSTDQSIWPRQVDQLLESVGIVAPNIGMTMDAHRNMRYSSIMDGMRLAQQKLPYPELKDFDSDGDGDLSDAEQERLRAAVQEWQENIIHSGESYASAAYLTRAVTGSFLPFNVQFQDERKDDMSELWALINVLPEDALGGDDLNSAIISAFLDANPDFGEYMTGKTIDLRRVDDPDESRDEFFEAVKEGKVKFRTPQEYAIFSWFMHSYSVYQSRVNGIYEAAGDTPAEVITNFDAKDALAREREAWEDFVTASGVVDNFLEGQSQSAEDMFNVVMGYRELRDARVGKMRLSLEQEQLLEADRIQGEYARFFGPNFDTSEDYQKLKTAAYEMLDNGPQTPLGMAQEWYFGGVQDKYYDKRNELFERLDTAEKRDQPAIFQAIREHSDKANHIYVNPEHPEWGEFPSPEAYVFMGLDNKAQERQVTEWAELPTEFLTEFQLEQVGYPIPEGDIELTDKQRKEFKAIGLKPDSIKTHADAASALSSFVNHYDEELDRNVSQLGLSYSSTSVKETREGMDRYYARLADSLGLGDYWEASHAEPYKRVDMALRLSQRSATWRQASDLADKLRGQVEAKGFVPGGQGVVDRGKVEQMVRAVREWRKNDSVFDTIMRELGVALEISGEDDLVMTLFFEVFDTGNAYYLD